MSESLVLLEKADGVALLTLNNPEKRNALSRAVLQELLEKLQQIADNSDVQAVILRANGPVFSSGHDLRELVGRDKEEYTSLFQLCVDVMEAIRKLPKPVIAQVHGIATAAGCQLVASCDLVVASDNATFATPGVKIGLFCTTPAVALSRAITPKKAMEMLLTGNSINADEAERIGLVNKVTTQDNLAATTMNLARQIINASAATLALGKAAYYEQLPHDFPEAYELAKNAMVDNALADDAQEGISAFLEKRAPRWNNAASKPAKC